MTTWISKARAFAVLGCLGLAACDGVTLPGLSTAPATESTEPLTLVSLSRGKVQLATPQGYCIDPRSLEQRFALIGRCDTLGAEGFFAAWELAIVTAAVVRVSPGSQAPDLAALPGSGEALRSVDRQGLTLTQFRSPSPDFEGVSDQYWRTAFVLNDHLVSLALYAPDTSSAVGDEGALILQNIATRTQAATAEASG